MEVPLCREVTEPVLQEVVVLERDVAGDKDRGKVRGAAREPVTAVLPMARAGDMDRGPVTVAVLPVRSARRLRQAAMDAPETRVRAVAMVVARAGVGPATELGNL